MIADVGDMGESAQYGAVENSSPPSDSLSNQSENIECSLDFASPIDSIYYFESPNGRLVNLEGPTAQVGTRVIFECTDSKAKTAFRECLADGQWSSQNNAIICDKWRYWAAVIAAATSAFIIIILLMYFTCSAYNKRKKRKYIARKERIREQDDLMMRNENFVRLNFRPLPLSVHPDAPENSSASAPEAAEVTSSDPGQT